LIIGFDVDGVIAKAPLGLHILLKIQQKGWNKLLATDLGKIIYQKLRFADKDIVELTKQLRVRGHSPVIITYAADGEEIKKWATKEEVPFDRIFTPKPSENQIDFKIRAILEAKCDFFVEDQPNLAKSIAARLLRTRVILYRRKENLNILKELS
jgi:uncharacterized HAD superfamily protein